MAQYVAHDYWQNGYAVGDTDANGADLLIVTTFDAVTANVFIASRFRIKDTVRIPRIGSSTRQGIAGRSGTTPR